MKCSVLGLALVNFALVDGYNYYMTASSACGLSMTTGTVIMSGEAVSGTRTVWFSDSSGNVLTCGVDEYIAGNK